ncbi:hypothetical protein PspLS_02716 [Pyricularia sp. CBS 133598]|nr:hypothetical protein PspLS_02716 [Pyricularia sp. CBS 133598]
MAFHPNQHPTHPVEYVKDDAHGHAELLKVQVSIIVDVGKVPHPLELIIAKSRVLEYGCRLLSREELGAVCPRAEDVPLRNSPVIKLEYHALTECIKSSNLNDSVGSPMTMQLAVECTDIARYRGEC